ncbi:Hydroxyacylglutathione hydrolase, mitochondrial [Glycine max]|nr:Hydroxyacylglutathione hydrolase, mitochondrial [Glycine max]
MKIHLVFNIIVDESTKEGAVVDPVEPQKVLEAANSHGVNNLKLVLTTHHHGDHAGGNEKIKQLVLGMKVYGGSMDNIKGCTDKPHQRSHKLLCYWQRGGVTCCFYWRYTVRNLLFALTIEPDNLRIQQKLTWAKNQQQAGQSTIPSTIEEEMETNPFMRVNLPEIQGASLPVEALRELRKLKDKWKGVMELTNYCILHV